MGEPSRKARVKPGGSGQSLRLKGRVCQRERPTRSRLWKTGVAAQDGRIWALGSGTVAGMKAECSGWAAGRNYRRAKSPLTGSSPFAL